MDCCEHVNKAMPDDGGGGDDDGVKKQSQQQLNKNNNKEEEEEEDIDDDMPKKHAMNEVSERWSICAIVCASLGKRQNMQDCWYVLTMDAILEAFDMVKQGRGLVQIFDAPPPDIVGFVDGFHSNSKDPRAAIQVIFRCCIKGNDCRGREEDEDKQAVACYDARARTLLRDVVQAVGLEWQVVLDMEEQHLRQLLELEQKTDSSMEASKRDGKMRFGTAAKIGAATFLGGAALFLTGGLAAPAVVAGLGMVGVGGVATAVGGTAIVTASALAFGGFGANMFGKRMARRVGDLDEFEFKSVKKAEGDAVGMHVVLGVSGFLTDEQDTVVEHWKCLDEMELGASVVALHWDPKILLDTGNVVSDFLKSQALRQMQTYAGEVMLGATFAVLAAPIFILNAGSWIDGAVTVAMNRADKCGSMLARELLQRIQGNRPVTLIGFGMGARAVFRCLKKLAKAPDGRGQGIVESAFIMAMPMAPSEEEWRAARSVVAHRLVNVYTLHDWVLRVVFRASNMTFSVAGIQPIVYEGLDVENYDASALLHNHSEYKTHLPELLNKLGLKSGIATPLDTEESFKPICAVQDEKH